MKNLAFAKDMIKVITLALGIYIVFNTYIKNTAAFHNPKGSYLSSYEEEEQRINTTYKRMLLNDSYERMMCEGDEYMSQDSFYLASRSYFNAKSIYPYRFESRIALCRAFVELAAVKDYFLPSAQKEIHYAFKYTDRTDDDRLVNELCDLDTEIVSIFDTASDKFKYWEELVALEDY